MNIEFHTPHGKVADELLSSVRDQLMEFHKMDKEISRAEVYFREDTESLKDKKICEIDLTIYGDSLYVRRKAGSYEQASKEVFRELSEKIKEQIGKQNEPPDVMTSTVEV